MNTESEFIQEYEIYDNQIQESKCDEKEYLKPDKMVMKNIIRILICIILIISFLAIKNSRQFVMLKPKIEKILNLNYDFISISKSWFNFGLEKIKLFLQ